MKKIWLIFIVMLIGSASYAQYTYPVKLITPDGVSWGLEPGGANHQMVFNLTPQQDTSQVMWVINIDTIPHAIFVKKVINLVVGNPLVSNTFYWDSLYTNKNDVLSSSINILPGDTCKSFVSYYHPNGQAEFTRAQYDFCVDTIWGEYNFFVINYDHWNLGINEHSVNKAQVSPNPTKGKSVIKSPELISNIEIFNIFGEKIYNSSPNKFQFEIDLSKYPNGTYLYYLNGKMSGKILKSD